MKFSHPKTNSTKFAPYRLIIRKVIEFFYFQSLIPLTCIKLASISAATHRKKHIEGLFSSGHDLGSCIFSEMTVDFNCIINLNTKYLHIIRCLVLKYPGIFLQVFFFVLFKRYCT